MLEKEAIQQRGFRNIKRGSEIVGYQLRVRSLYYRGLWLSQITNFKLKVNGEEVDNEIVRWTIGGNTYTLNEMKERADVHWNILEPALISVMKSGGLESGTYLIEVDILHSSSYMPPDMDHVLSTQGQKRELILV